MAILRPANLKCISFYVDQNLLTQTDLVLGKLQEDGLIFYLDYVVMDAGTASSFTGGTVVLEYSPTQGGTQVVIDTTTLADGSEITEVTQDGLTSTAVVPAGSWFFWTGATLAGISYGIMLQIWYQSMSEN